MIDGKEGWTGEEWLSVLSYSWSLLLVFSDGKDGQRDEKRLKEGLGD